MPFQYNKNSTYKNFNNKDFYLNKFYLKKKTILISKVKIRFYMSEKQLKLPNRVVALKCQTKVYHLYD